MLKVKSKAFRYIFLHLLTVVGSLILKERYKNYTTNKVVLLNSLLLLKEMHGSRRKSNLLNPLFLQRKNKSLILKMKLNKLKQTLQKNKIPLKTKTKLLKNTLKREINLMKNSMNLKKREIKLLINERKYGIMNLKLTMKLTTLKLVSLFFFLSFFSLSFFRFFLLYFSFSLLFSFLFSFNLGFNFFCSCWKSATSTLFNNFKRTCSRYWICKKNQERTQHSRNLCSYYWTLFMYWKRNDCNWGCCKRKSF